VARTAILTLSIFLMTAAQAFASESGHDGGEGWYGVTNDKVVTNFGFLLIALFPLIALTFSLIQWRLDKRKDRRKAAAKARAGSPEWSGGW
jgi:preprotein translocase subunit SecG